ncbi:hypothetical protein BC832DRAFT_600593 [Gaertneriomyces semiglobifer]|nr:hypothetical protein BC832DRAFT_600593 [Gaertneriomyces semiglobifer]
MGAAVAPAPAEVSETIALDIALQLQDIAELRASLKGKGKDPSDEEIALESYENELRAMLLNTGDIQLAWSIARAVRTDSSALAAAQTEENQASVDRKIAQALANGGTLADAVADARRGTDSEKGKEKLHDFQWSGTDSESDASKADGSVHSGSLRLEDLEASTDSDEEVQAGPSGYKRPHVACVACGDGMSEESAYRASCSHSYCKDCLRGLFLHASSNGSFRPPRCCGQDVPHDSAISVLSVSELTVFKDKVLEFSTPNPLYCPGPGCGVFIHPSKFNNASDSVTCHACGISVCTRCRSRGHHGQDCPQTPGIAELQDLAKLSGWRQCYNCNRMVELMIGCFHIYCVCGAEFCYICGVRWKRCNCRTWDEHRLYAQRNAPRA